MVGSIVDTEENVGYQEFSKVFAFPQQSEKDIIV